MDLRPSPGRVLAVDVQPRLLTHLLRWTLVCWVVIFWRLDYVALLDDGAHYAQLTREMLQRSSWLVPILDGSPYIDKPVLFHWLQGLAFWLFGESELAARMPSALSAIVLFALTRFLGRRLFESSAGERAWLMLATVPATFVLSRVGYLDMLFTTFTFGAVACLLVSALDDRPKLQYVGYAALAFAVMTKGPVALVLVGAFFAFAWVADRQCRSAIRALDWKVGLCLVVLGSAPWFIWMHGRFGDDFVRDYLLMGHVFYLAPRASGSSADHGFYLEMFVTVFFPWSLVAIGYLVDTGRRRWRGISPSAAEKFLWLWIATVVVVFTAARFRVDRYVFPAAPACCLLAARAWLCAKREASGSEYAATRLAVFAVALLMAVFGVVLALRLPTLDLDLPVTAFLLPAVLGIGGLVILVSMLRHGLRPPAVLNMPIGVLIAVYALVVALGFPVLEQLRPTRQVGAWLNSSVPETGRVGLYGLDRWQSALRFYATRPVERLASEEEARQFLLAGKGQWIVTRREVFDNLVVGDPGIRLAFTVPAVVGTSGSGIRRQLWSDVVVARRTH
jgi:4-amino-4-deoxy-L-arabinose transferase-like glycosyltransferase